MKIIFYSKKNIILGIGDWGLGPIPNPQSPIPTNFFYFLFGIFILKN